MPTFVGESLLSREKKMLSLKGTLAAAATATVLMLPSLANAEPEAEVLHWWTSGGESKAVKALMDEFSSNGGTWTDMPVAGGGGDAAMTALKARVLSGNPPTAVQLKGPSIQEWAEEGALGNLDDVGKAEKWDSLLPPQIANHMKFEGKYVAAPVNVHRVDWIWANPKVLAKAGVGMPTTWDEFNRAADKIKAMGITPLAHGGQSWQDATVFETVVLGIGGNDFYKKALVDLDMAALDSPTMVKVFDQMRRMRGYVDANFSGRDWNLATAMVMNGEAAFQIMGDWAKGEFLAAGKKPGTDFLCSPTPGQGYLYNVDSFAMFNVKGDDNVAGQKLLAKLIVGENFQKIFNLYKGSIPARLGVAMGEFEYCAHRSAYDMEMTASVGGLLPSYAHGMALRGAQAGAITDVVTKHFNSDMSSAAAAKALAEAVKQSL
jgi:glucose/mannose transport system substrate-binding protein